MGLRRQVSLLLSEGHPLARHYPLPMLWLEATLVERRHCQRMAVEASLVQGAAASVLDKKAAQAFRKQLRELTED